MDETSIQNEYATRKGYVIQMDPAERVQANCFYQRIEMRSTRAHSTLVGVIAARPEVQDKLPQIFIPNWGKLTNAEKDVYKEGLQSPIEVWQGFHGWVTSEVMKQLITRYRAAVRNIDDTATLVLISHGRCITTFEQGSALARQALECDVGNDTWQIDISTTTIGRVSFSCAER